MQPFFTIVVPTLNAEKKLPEALSSIVEQRFKSLEVLIIDGLSSDRTVEIAKKFKSEIPTIKIISERDKGIYDAMNNGVKYSTGKWLYFMGADDRLYNESVLNSIYNFIRNDTQGSEVIYGNVKSGYFKDFYDGKFTKWKIYRKNICHQAIFFNRSVFSKIGGFNLNYKVLADWDHNIRWFFHGNIKYHYLDVVVAHYGEDGFSSKHTDEKFNKNKKFIIATNIILFLKSFFKTTSN